MTDRECVGLDAKVSNTTGSLPPHTAGVTSGTPGYYGTCLAILAVVEIASALYLSSLNAIQGYDENWYLINAHRFVGDSSLPYAVHRPPLLPLLFAIFGSYGRYISALAHIGATVAFFLILRRLLSPRAVLASVALFMACADIRLYNVLSLTEMPGISLTLVAIYLFMTRRAWGAGVVCLLLFMLHWGYVSVVPAFLLVYVWQRRWREGVAYTVGWLVASVPFMVAFAFVFGDPLAPVEGSFAIQAHSVNDVWFYVRGFPQLPVGLMAGGVVSLFWLMSRRREWFQSPQCALVILLLAIVGSRVSMLHFYESKAARYLIPAVPALMLLCVLMLRQYAARFPRATLLAGFLLTLSILPTKRDFYEVYGLAMDQTHAILDLRDEVAGAYRGGPVYTDLNDLAVMGECGVPSVAVTGDGSWHHYLSSRARCLRGEVPTGALYLTWNPGPSEVIARAESPRSGTLYLVRWRGTSQTLANRFDAPGTSQ